MGKECERVTVAMKRGAVEEDAELVRHKRRKMLYAETGSEDVECGENSASPSTSTSRTSGCCKDGDETSDVVERSLRAPDLEVNFENSNSVPENIGLNTESFETEILTSLSCGFSREATPTSELCGDSEEVLMNSRPTKKPYPALPRRKASNSAAAKMPTAAELEEFFAVGEKYEQKRFAEKYNYDIVKDVPLEGKYQWVRLQP